MSECEHNLIIGIEVGVIVQAVLTIILTIAVIMLVIQAKSVPEIIQAAWLVSVGLWIPMPTSVSKMKK